MAHMLKPSPSVIAGKRAEEERKRREKVRGRKIKRREKIEMKKRKEEESRGDKKNQ